MTDIEMTPEVEDLSEELSDEALDRDGGGCRVCAVCMASTT